MHSRAVWLFCSVLQNGHTPEPQNFGGQPQRALKRRNRRGACRALEIAITGTAVAEA
jgi:hypothetical protein